MADLAVIILTYNEERHIARCLASISGISREIYVVDSYSQDETVNIARSMGATILQNPFVNQAKQFNWALENAPIAAGWIMRLDADEIIEADLADEINEKLPALPPDVAGINLKRKHIFLDRWIRHGGRYPLLLTRIWRKGCGIVEDKWMDEHVVISGGSVVTFKGGFADHNLNDLTFFTDKHNKYATREAVELLGKQFGLFTEQGHDPAATHSLSLQARAKRLIKERVYNRIPFQFSAMAYFSYRYFLQLGFLDGIEGAIYHGLQGFWYRFLVGAKRLEFERAVRHLISPSDIRAELARLTGLKL